MRTQGAALPDRIQRQRTKGWRMPEGAVYVGRPTIYGNPFHLNTPHALMRMPGAADRNAEAEYEGRISAHGARHDYFHPGGEVTRCTVRYMTPAESVEHYRRLLTGDLTPAMRSAGHRPGLRGHNRGRGAYRVTEADVVRDLRGRDLACWCPLDQPCHADVLLSIANADVEFNALHEVGAPVRYWPGVREGDGIESVTRSEAWLMGGHSPVVMIEGYPGGIALSHVEVQLETMLDTPKGTDDD